jgi:hypothetical protein
MALGEQVKAIVQAADGELPGAARRPRAFPALTASWPAEMAENR